MSIFLDSAIQTAYYELLNGNISVPVVDKPKPNQSYPYVFFGGITSEESDEVSSKDSPGFEILVPLNIVTGNKEDSTVGGKKQAQTIAEEIEAILDGGRNVVVSEAAMVVSTLDSSGYEEDYLEPDKVTVLNMTYRHLANISSGSGTPPDAPVLSVACFDADSISLDWTSIISDGYQLERKLGAGAYSIIANRVCSDYIDTDVVEDSTYSYRVLAYNQFGNSAYSNEVIATASGTSIVISYNWPMPGGVTTSYRSGDDASIEAIIFKPARDLETGTVVKPTLSDFLTLVKDNSFGNKDRFTDSKGGQIYGAGNSSIVDYIIDNYTGLGWSRVYTLPGVGWDASIDNALASGEGGFSDWFVANKRQMQSITNIGLTSVFNYAPFNYTLTRDVWSSTTYPVTTTSAMAHFRSGGIISITGKGSTTPIYFLCRKHF